MLEITVMNCDDKKVQYEWVSKREFIDDIDSDNENIPMLDDVLTAVDTDDDEIHNWWKNTDEMTVGDLYKECNCRLKDEHPFKCCWRCQNLGKADVCTDCKNGADNFVWEHCRQF